MRYIKEFANATALQAAVDNGELGRPYLCYLQDQSKIAWDSEEPGPTPETPNYLRFNIKSDGVIYWKALNNYNTKTIEYSLDSGKTWNEITSNTSAPSINVVTGNVILFRGNNNQYDLNQSSRWNGFSGTTCQFDVEGNIMSLVYGDNFSDKCIFPENSNRNFGNLFNSCTGLTSAENLILPATALTEYCYQNMFQGCKSLTTAPELPATTLVNGSLYYMFSGCTHLNYIKCLATNISAYRCTYRWVRSVAAKGTFVKKTGATWSTGGDGIPSGWTVIEE